MVNPKHRRTGALVFYITAGCCIFFLARWFLNVSLDDLSGKGSMGWFMGFGFMATVYGLLYVEGS